MYQPLGGGRTLIRPRCVHLVSHGLFVAVDDVPEPEARGERIAQVNAEKLPPCDDINALRAA